MDWSSFFNTNYFAVGNGTLLTIAGGVYHRDTSIVAISDGKLEQHFFGQKDDINKREENIVYLLDTPFAKIYNFIGNISFNKAKVYNIVIGSNQENNEEFLISLEPTQTNYNRFRSTNKSIQFTKKFTKPPMYIYLPEREFPHCFISQSMEDDDGNSINLYSIDETKKEINLLHKIMRGKLNKNHQSALVDLTGDLKSEIVLHCDDDGKEVLFVGKASCLSIDASSSTTMVKITLEGNVCKLLPIPRCDGLMYDFYYTTEINGKYFLKHLKNNAKGVATIDELNSKYKALEFLEKYKANELSSNLLVHDKKVVEFGNNLTPGVFSFIDTQADGTLDFLFVDSNGKLMVKRRTIKNKGEYEFIDQQVGIQGFGSVLAKSTILNIGVTELPFSHEINLVFNYKVNRIGSKQQISAVGLKTHQLNNKNNLTLIYRKAKGERVLVPGATMLVGVDNGRQVLRVSQSMQTSVPSKFYRNTLFGVGRSQLFLTYIIFETGFNYANPQYRAVNIVIFPSTYTFIHTNKNYDILVYCYFELSRFRIVVICLFTTGICGIIILCILTHLENRIIRKKAEYDRIRIFLNSI